MIVSSTGASTTWFSGFLDALVAATFGAGCLFVMDLRATPPARRTFNFTFFAVARLAAELRLTLALALRCFNPFLRLATFVLAISPSPTEDAIKQSRNKPTITALDDSPQWRFAISIAHRSQRWRVRLKSPDPEQAIPENYQLCRSEARFGRRSAPHDRVADGPAVIVTNAFFHLRA
jgi:hypothetical protein